LLETVVLPPQLAVLLLEPTKTLFQIREAIHVVHPTRPTFPRTEILGSRSRQAVSWTRARENRLGAWRANGWRCPLRSAIERGGANQIHRILDGAALLDEIRHVDQGGHANFRGATFRTYLPDTDRW